jgi:two-component system response regulator GlrR
LIKGTKIFILDFNPSRSIGKELQEILESFNLNIHLKEKPSGASVASFCSSEHFEIIARFSPDIIFVVLSPTQTKQFSVLIQSLRIEQSELPIIIVIEGIMPDEMIELLKLGVSDFITSPIKSVDIIPRIWRHIEQKHRGDTLINILKEKLGLKQLIGRSPIFLAEIEKISMITKCDASVIISGETGTGKELCARTIHYLGLRAGKPFVPVNCGAIPAELVENELFGHIKGAFTGASLSQIGLINEAEGGTLFLDEVDCLPLHSQVKILRLLQEKEYRQLGSPKIHQADVRIISATNIELEKAMIEGNFRQDLYYRLNVIPLMLPPLRERKEDISILTQHFLDKYASEFNKQISNVTSEALQKLIVYEWPGNVRELENVIKRAVIFCKKTSIQDVDIVLKNFDAPKYQKSFKEAKYRVIEQFEKSYIQGLLLAYNGNITRAAKAAQKNRRAFYELIRKHHIENQVLKPDPMR